mmetsp:Transcript_32490/g.29321  ORF Transcript_32490/g.29321 Transcript_32490/m.29321 type:complete len:323 (+) Transcript_32490:1715-2683(+)
MSLIQFSDSSLLLSELFTTDFSNFLVKISQFLLEFLDAFVHILELLFLFLNLPFEVLLLILITGLINQNLIKFLQSSSLLFKLLTLELNIHLNSLLLLLGLGLISKQFLDLSIDLHLLLSHLIDPFNEFGRLLLQASNIFLRIVILHLMAHTSLLGLTTTRHSTRQIDELTILSDTSISGRSISNIGSSIDVLADQSISKGIIEGDLELVILGIHQIKESVSALRNLKISLHMILDPIDLVKGDEGGSTDLVGSQHLDTLLCIIESVDNDMVKLWAGGSNSDIIVLVNDTQIPQSTVDTGELLLLLCLHKLSNDLVLDSVLG